MMNYTTEISHRTTWHQTKLSWRRNFFLRMISYRLCRIEFSRGTLEREDLVNAARSHEFPDTLISPPGQNSPVLRIHWTQLSSIRSIKAAVNGLIFLIGKVPRISIQYTFREGPNPNSHPPKLWCFKAVTSFTVSPLPLRRLRFGIASKPPG